MTQIEIANEAFNRLNDRRVLQGLKALGETSLQRARYYAGEAPGYLATITSWDPTIDVPRLADEAMIEYVIAYISGFTPETSDSFLIAAQSWADRSAEAHYRDEIESDVDKELNVSTDD